MEEKYKHILPEVERYLKDHSVADFIAIAETNFLLQSYEAKEVLELLGSRLRSPSSKDEVE